MILNVMRREKELNACHRYVMPELSIVCCIFFCVAAVVSHGKAVLYYLIVFAVIMALAIPFYRQGKEKTDAPRFRGRRFCAALFRCPRLYPSKHNRASLPAPH